MIQYNYCKEWRPFQRRIKFEWRSKKNITGRFGGGWNWELGFQLGGSTLIVNLLVCSLRFEFKKHVLCSTKDCKSYTTHKSGKCVRCYLRHRDKD